MIAPEFDALNFDLLMEVDSLYFGHAVLQVCLRVEHFIGTDVAHFDKVREKPLVYSFGGVSHEAFAFELGFLEEPGQGTTVVQMETELNERLKRIIFLKKQIFCLSVEFCD